MMVCCLACQNSRLFSLSHNVKIILTFTLRFHRLKLKKLFSRYNKMLI